MIREIEIWFTSKAGREMLEAKNLRDAKKICLGLSEKGFDGVVVDVTFYSTRNGERHDLIKNKSKLYSFDNGKLKLI